MNGYPKIIVGHEYRVTASCWKGWEPGDVATVTAVSDDTVSVRCVNGDLVAMKKSSFRAIFNRHRGE